MTKHVYRSKGNKVFAGVLGGLGEYFEIDPVILRVIWLAITVFTGFVPGIVVYILAIFVIPVEPTTIVVSSKGEENSGSETPKK